MPSDKVVTGEKPAVNVLTNHPSKLKYTLKRGFGARASRSMILPIKLGHERPAVSETSLVSSGFEIFSSSKPGVSVSGGYATCTAMLGLLESSMCRHSAYPLKANFVGEYAEKPNTPKLTSHTTAHGYCPRFHKRQESIGNVDGTQLVRLHYTSVRLGRDILKIRRMGFPRTTKQMSFRVRIFVVVPALHDGFCRFLDGSWVCHVNRHGFDDLLFVC